MRRSIDGDVCAPGELSRQVLLEFGALAPGEAVEVHADSDLQEVFDALQAERAGTFDWTVLQDGPERFRVEIRRRSQSGGLGIRDVLQSDHDRLDRVAAEVTSLLEGPRSDAVGARLAQLAAGIERHFTQEETVLFAAIADASEQARAHVEELQREHDVIRSLVRSLREAFAAERASDWQVTAASLCLALKRHARKELWLLYPLLDEFTGERRAALLRAMEQI